MTSLAYCLTRAGARTTAYDQRRVFASRSVVRRYLAAHPRQWPTTFDESTPIRSIDSLITRDMIRAIKRAPTDFGQLARDVADALHAVLKDKSNA